MHKDLLTGQNQQTNSGIESPLVSPAAPEETRSHSMLSVGFYIF
jgi:hypothetical protein